MAKLLTVEVTFGQTVPIPIDESGRNFRYVRADATLRAELEPGDSEDAVARLLWMMARRNVQINLSPKIAQGEEAFKAFWFGLSQDQRAALFPHLDMAQQDTVRALPPERGGIQGTEADGSTRAMDPHTVMEGGK
jgi:hypothetical protein